MFDLVWVYFKYDLMFMLSFWVGWMGMEFFMMVDLCLVVYFFFIVWFFGDYFWYLLFFSIDGGDIVLIMLIGVYVLCGKFFYGIFDGSFLLVDW